MSQFHISGETSTTYCLQFLFQLSNAQDIHNIHEDITDDESVLGEAYDESLSFSSDDEVMYDAWEEGVDLEASDGDGDGEEVSFLDESFSTVEESPEKVAPSTISKKTNMMKYVPVILTWADTHKGYSHYRL